MESTHSFLEIFKLKPIPISPAFLPLGYGIDENWLLLLCHDFHNCPHPSLQLIYSSGVLAQDDVCVHVITYRVIKKIFSKAILVLNKIKTKSYRLGDKNY